MSLYADYIKEHTLGDVLETDYGFATYVFPDEKTCYIREIYIDPAHRLQGKASLISDMVVRLAKERGCSVLLGSVVPSAKKSTESLKALLAYGFRLESSTNDYILFRKDLT